MRGDDISDEELLYIVGTTDRELFDSGLDIKRRYVEVPRVVMRKFGYLGFYFSGTGAPPIYKRIENAFSSIYRSQDLASGGHIGVFMYRDIFARISVPMGFGKFSINPFDCVDMTPIQLRMIQTEPEQVSIFLDQFIDVCDVQWGISEMKSPYRKNELVARLIGLARLHLHSAAAVLTGGFDYRGAVQSALLATELALKSGAAGMGMNEVEIRNRFGHKTKDVAIYVGMNWSNFDTDRILRVVDVQPGYVPNRYSATQPDRREVGTLVMGAQYVVSEVVRQISDRDFRSYFNSQTRKFPE